VEKLNERRIAHAAKCLRAEFGFRYVASYIDGKTRFRDQLHRAMRMSMMRSEEAVFPPILAVYDVMKAMAAMTHTMVSRFQVMKNE